MIIDADVHISPTKEGGNSILVEELIDRMDQANVDKAITWIQPPYVRDNLNNSLKYVYESSKRYPERILGFGWADPNLGIENAKDTVKRCIEEYGFYGVKLNGAQNTFYIDDPKISLPLIEMIASYGKVIGFHTGADVKDFTHPYRVGKIAKMFPEAKFLMIHMGGASFDDYSEAAIEVARECPNVTLVGSAIRSIPLIKAMKEVGTHRVAFASDTPFELMYLEVEKYLTILKKEFTKEDVDQVMYKTIASVLDLS